MIEGKKAKEMNSDSIQLSEEYKRLLQEKKKVKPNVEAFRIILLYLLIGGLWILLSDTILAYLVKSDEIFKEIQLYKGWFYVFITGFIFFEIIRKTLILYKRSIERVSEGYEKLNIAYEIMTVMNQEADQKNVQLEKQKNALLVSEQRYELAVEGANDGIWDWDLVNDVYFISSHWKYLLGYTDEELPNTVEAWMSLFYPGEAQKIIDYVNEYLEGGDGIYQAVYRIRKKSGEYRFISSRGKGVWAKNGVPLRIAGSHTDITLQRLMEEKLETLAYFDNMVGLPNRVLFEQKIIEFIEKSVKFSIVNLDIDDFKHINDIYGRIAGDAYIQHIADLLSSEIKKTDVAARFGGGQFALLLLETSENESVLNLINHILNEIRKPWNYGEYSLYGTVSAGIVSYPHQEGDVSSLIQKAEMAMYSQKDKGKDGYSIFDASMYEKTLNDMQMHIQLRQALENNEFLLYYQPQYELVTGKLLCAEALIRWNHPQRGFVSPMEFIPLAEKTRYILPITLFVIKSAIIQRREWINKGYEPLKIAVNLSGHVIMEPGGMEEIYNLLDEYRVLPGELEIEVTETAIMLELNKAKESLHKLKEYGMSIAIDDFGTGYSSLTYLHTLPFDILKIDREFIKDVQNEEEESFIYKTVVDLAHNMKLKVVAEGIETKEQKEFLLKNHCDIGQGYYFERPMHPDKMEPLLNQENREEYDHEIL